MTISKLADEIYSRYGTVTRARNCFLYTKKGVRLTDLFQENGRAILGWDGKNAFTYFKNFLSRAQVGSFVCEDSSRVEKAISSLLASERKIFYFSSKKEALTAALKHSPENTSMYKPWKEGCNWSTVDSVIIEPPLPWTNTVYILAVLNTNQKEVSKEQPENSVTIPFAMEAAIARSIYNLIEALQVRQEKDWFIYDTVLTKYWTRKGPYLEPKIPQEKYDDFVIHCLNLGIVINPDYNSPSIVPFGADRGVFTQLKNSPFDFN